MIRSTSTTARAVSASRRAAQALISAVLLIAVLVGFPLLMSQLVGWPLPETLLSLNELRQVATEQLSARTVVDVLAVGAWLAWAHFVLCVLVELRGALTGKHLRVPFGGVNQQFAGKLVAAVLLSATVSASSGLTPAAAYASAEPPAAGAGISQTQLPAGNVSTTPPAPAPAPQGAAVSAAGEQQAWRLYTVQAAHQGYADNLWDIAERHLGDGTRWADILELNRGRGQGAGGRLTDPDVLRAGWQLRMPAGATDLPLETPAAAEQQSAGQHVVQPGETLHEIAHDELGATANHEQLYDTNRGRAQPDGGQLTDPDLIRPGWVLDLPGAEPAGPVTLPPPAAISAPDEVPAPAVVPAPNAMTPEAPPVVEAPAPAELDTPGRAGQSSSQDRGERQQGATTPQVEVDQDEQDQDEQDQVTFPVRTTGGVGALLAAGVLALLASRRGLQQRRRKPGQRLVLPTGPAAQVEQELRLVADPLGVETVDVALRHMAASYAHAGESLPVVRAARLTGEQFDLYLAEQPEHDLPAPFRGTVDTCVWTLYADAPELQGMALADVAAPYPSLVTIGHDAEGGHVLLDLEYLGALGVDGDPVRTRAVLAAIAVELATSVWADDLQVTVVGAFPEMEEGLGTGRIQYLPAVGQLLEHLRVRASADRGVLAAVGAPDLNFARANDLAEGIWTPEIVLLAGPVTDSQRAALEDLTRALPRVAVAAVTSGEPVAEWVIRLDRDDPSTAVIDPIGLRIQPQQLDEQTLEQVLEVLGLADQMDDGPEGELAAEVTLADLAHVQPHSEEPAIVADGQDATYGDEAATGGPQEDGGEPGPNLSTADLGELLTKRRGPQNNVDASAIQAQPDVDETPAAAGREDTPEKASAQVLPLPGAAPRVLLLGPVTVVDAVGPLERKPDRYIELAAFLVVHPGSDHHAIDAAYSPEEPLSAKTRRSVLSRLRRWLGRDSDGKFYLPTHPMAGRYRLSEAVSSDWQRWCELLPDGPGQASTEALVEALGLVRGRPGGDIPARRYAWAEHLFQEMISAVGDAAYELARRRLLDGQWRAAEQAAVSGLMVEPGMESLWRARILAAYSSGNDTATQEAIDRLMHMAARLGTDLEDETEQLLEQLQGTDRAQRELLLEAL